MMRRLRGLCRYGAYGRGGGFARSGGLVDNSACSYKMFIIISVVHIADHDSGYAGVDEFIVAEIDAYMGDGPVFAKGVEEYQVTFL